MPHVTFLNGPVSVEVPAGTTLLDAALFNGIEMEHACGGNAACASCHVLVDKGWDNLSEMLAMEEFRLDKCRGGPTSRSRLGCQAEILGDVTLLKNPR